jgi:hypothetical protein
MAWFADLGQQFATTRSRLPHRKRTQRLLLKYHVNIYISATGGAFGVEGSLITLLLIAAAGAYWLRRALRDD